MIILCADDFGISDGVSRGIEALARRGRISATSALATFEDWPETAQRLVAQRDRVAIGIHLNLTLGAPAGPMPHVAPGGQLPRLGYLVARASARQLDRSEIEAEIRRQLERFVAGTGVPPDHIDGHQHVHALPVVRDALLDAVAAMEWAPRPLIRSPEDSYRAILRRGGAVRKAAILSMLTRGFRARLVAEGWHTNQSFAGVSQFRSGQDFGLEVERAFRLASGTHLVMCHPGYPDAVLAGRDPVVTRRLEELEALMAMVDLDRRIWHPSRSVDGGPVNWSAGG